MRRTWVVFVVSLLLVAGSGGWIAGTMIQASNDSSFIPEGNRESALAAESASASASPSPTPSLPGQAPSASPTPSQTLYPIPTKVRIPALDVDSTIVPTGLDKHDNMEIPEDIFTIGWYDLGVPPGADTGSAVLVGHRDGRKQGHGAFYSIGSLKPGNKIQIERADGSALSYRVVSRELIDKKGFIKAAPELFAVDGPPRLTLLSCGGTYDRDNGGYQANVVVTAVPV